MSALPPAWQHPPNEFSLVPFWFWNDHLDDAELLRQMDAFRAHGVEAFVIHPRVGLPRELGWMSRALLNKMHTVIRAAQARQMWVMLYDEGMYPSGSSSGQVVAQDPAYQCRALVRINLSGVVPNTLEQGVQIDAHGQLQLGDRQTLIAQVTYEGTPYAIVQRPVDARIRGLHYLHEETPNPPEDSPLAIDLLNPSAVRCFIRLVYQRYADEFGAYFGDTVRAIFTDEPMLLGRLEDPNVFPATPDILPRINAILGYDFTPYLPALWNPTAPAHIRADYQHALEVCLAESYYQQLYDWCEQHNIALTGHPAEPDDTRNLRFFHMAGQDIVWRHIEPDTPSALVGRASTQAKAAASVMVHTQRRRNINEFCGAYGHTLTFDEMRWLAHWLLVRGCNLLIPHAFYYSVRGVRYHERPPDVGLHSAWWGASFSAFAWACRRLSWLNTDSLPVCHVAIVGAHHRLGWRAAKHCFEHQIDFHYLDVDDLPAAHPDPNGRLVIAQQHYRALIVDGELPASAEAQLAQIGAHVPVLNWDAAPPQTHLATLARLLPPSPFAALNAPALRVRQLQKHGATWFMLFNESGTPLHLAFSLENAHILDPATAAAQPYQGALTLAGYALQVLYVLSEATL